MRRIERLERPRSVASITVTPGSYSCGVACAACGGKRTIAVRNKVLTKGVPTRRQLKDMSFLSTPQILVSVSMTAGVRLQDVGRHSGIGRGIILNRVPQTKSLGVILQALRR